MFNYINSRSDVFEAVTDICTYLLRKDPEARKCREYLDSRLSKEEQVKYGFGYFPTSDNLKYLIDSVGRKHLEDFSIIYNKYNNNGAILSGHFSEHNMIMPFRDVHGDIVSLLGRTILPDDLQKERKIQKYKYSVNADKELYVYGLDLAKSSILEKGYVICVEGQFDCIACHRKGIHNVVALGWATLSRYQFYQLSKYTDNIVLLLDSDEAGIKGVNRAKSRYGDIVNIKSISPPFGYKDIDDFFKKEPSEERKSSAVSLLKNLVI